MSKKIYVTLPDKLYAELKELQLPVDSNSQLVVLALQLYLRKSKMIHEDLKKVLEEIQSQNKKK